MAKGKVIKPASKPASPKKAGQVPNMRKQLLGKKEKPVPTISAYGFEDPLAVEAYEYTITDTKPGFIHRYRLWAKGDLEVEALTAANFNNTKVQRDMSKRDNEPLLDGEGYSRVWLVRYPPGGESTADTRKEGLQILKTFFMSKIATDYPPKSIQLVDKTTDVPNVLDMFFLDNDIEEIIKVSFEITELEQEFYRKYPICANMIYTENEPSLYAKEHLGFPSCGQEEDDKENKEEDKEEDDEDEE